MYHSNGAIIMSFKTHSYYLPFFLCFITFWQFVHLSPCVSKECFHCGIRTPTRTSKQLSTFKLMAAACIWQTKAFATFAANILFLCMNCHVMLEKERDQNFGKIRLGRQVHVNRKMPGIVNWTFRNWTQSNSICRLMPSFVWVWFPSQSSSMEQIKPNWTQSIWLCLIGFGIYPNSSEPNPMDCVWLCSVSKFAWTKIVSGLKYIKKHEAT